MGRVALAFASVLSFVLLVAASASARCSITSVVPLNFGGYDPASSSPAFTAGEVTVECDADTPVRISLGRGVSARQNPRQLRSRGNSLDYNIYLDAGYTTIWGDGTSGTQVFQGVVPAGRGLRIPMFARLAPRQSVPPGVYTDRIMVVVVF